MEWQSCEHACEGGATLRANDAEDHGRDVAVERNLPEGEESLGVVQHRPTNAAFRGNPKPRRMLVGPSACGYKCRPESSPTRVQIDAVLDLDELRRGADPAYEEIGRISTPVEAVLECERDGLRDDRSGGVEKARQGDEISFEGTLVFRSARGERLEANDVGASAERNPPQSPSGSAFTQFTIMAHFKVQFTVKAQK